jgi:peptidoglycan/LPS O-acetylase OafA/YrhL
MTSPGRYFAPIDFKTRFPALNGIRALAILMVFTLHYGGGTHGGPLLHLVNTIRLRGWAGVDLFFTLSGFLITGILYDTRSDSHFFKRFFVRRSVRIFPVFYLLIVVLLLLTPLFQYRWRLGHLPYLIYMGNFASSIDPSLNLLLSANHPAASAYLGHLWSLCVEEQFYFIWPLVIWLVRDRVSLIWLAGSLSFTALAMRITLVLTLSPKIYGGWMLSMLPFRMDGLLMGSILALVLRGPSADLWQRSCKWIFLLASAVLVACTMLQPDTSAPWLITIGVSAIAIASTGLIGTTLRPASLASRLFSLQPLQVLGKYSYGFYIYHLIWAAGWASLVAFLTHRLHSSVLANAISITVSFIATFIVAQLSYNLFEVPFLHLKKRFEYDSELKSREHAFTTR